ncbi:MAG: pantetheine-phosphate adenylyltransferase [Rhodospirillales bacterium]|nr:pantetheine-phosphate adenylyltransferase [Rhodospirillales bacterium]
MSRIGIYPGTFDPITNGHIDIISRAIKVVDKLVIGVAVNAGKGPLFNLDQRVNLVEHEIAHLAEGDLERIKVKPFEGLLTDLAVDCGATLIVRGLRAVSDFEYEFQMTGMNRRLNPDIETVFLTASEKHQFISSRLVKEIVSMGGDITHFVTPNVRQMLLDKFS